MILYQSHVCIIGSGPGGAAAFHKLLSITEASVNLFEAGPDLAGKQVSKASKATKSPPWYHNGWSGNRFEPSVYANVAGASKFYAAALFRFREHDFEAQNYGDLVSPAWPFSYADLEPFYCEAETLYNVHGTPEDDPGAAPRSQPYPAEAIEHEPSLALIAHEMDTRGWTPMQTPVGMHAFDPKARQAKLADAQNSCLEPALATYGDRGQLYSEHRVTRLICDDPKSGVIRAIEGITADDQPFRAEAEVFILAAGASHSPLLLQASHVHGQGRQDLIGANYMYHTHTMVPVIDSDLAKTVYGKTLSFNRYYGSGQAVAEAPFGHVQVMGAMTSELAMAYLPDKLSRFLPKNLFKPILDNMVMFLVSTEDLPLANNRIQQDDRGRIRLDYKPTLLEEHAALVRHFCDDLRESVQVAADMDESSLLWDATLIQPMPPLNALRNLDFFQSIKQASNAHQCGTLKMGDDPADSVVDPQGRLWGMANLYVTDASVFPSSAHVNPTLTIVANSLRVATGLAKSL